MGKTKLCNYEKGRGAGLRRSLLPGLLAAIGMFGISITVVAALIGKGSVALDQVGLCAKLLYALAATTGCFWNARRAKRAKLLWSGLTAAMLLLLSLGAMLLMAQQGQARSAAALLALSFAAFLLGGLLGALRKRSALYSCLC